MAGLFPQEWMEEVMERNNIVDVVSSYVPLTKKGKKHWGLCPFHSEKTPSFSVDEDKQLYYCFGCKAGGNMVHFVMNLEKLSFREAVLFLAERVGMQPPMMENSEEADRKRREKQRLYELCREAAKAYNGALLSEGGAKARGYLAKRGVSQSVITRFGLGYADVGWDSMTNHLLQKGYTLEEIQSSGLCIVRNGRKFDFFRDRVIFPIIDQYGRVLGFGGRLIEGDGPKYINSPDTPVYNKRHMLYGLNFHKKFPSNRELIVVEGYMDQISVSCAGIINVVASLGTSLTVEQARLMRRFADRVYICYDGDFAGQAATLRGLEILDGEGLDVRVVSLPDGLDPDDFVKKYGPVGMRDVMDKAFTLMEFKLEMLRRELDMNTENGRMAFAKRGAAMVRGLDPVEAERYLKRIAQMTGFSYASLERQTAQSRQKENTGGSVHNTMVKEERRDYGAEELLLALCAGDGEFTRLAMGYVAPEDFALPLHQRLWEAILDLGPEKVSQNGVLMALSDGDDASAASGILSRSLDGVQNRESVEDLCANVLRSREERRLAELYARVGQTQGEERKSLLKEIGTCNKHINELKDGIFPGRRSSRE